MLDQLRWQAAAFLAAHHTGVLSTSGAAGAWAMPVRYCSDGLQVTCLIPRWADVAYFVEQDAGVLFLIVDAEAPARRWLQIEGVASAAADPDWAAWLPDWASALPPSEFYLLLRIIPCRLEWFDEGRGWGAREGIELLPACRSRYSHEERVE